MMDRFGVDLGTTNSAVCYYNEERKAHEFLKIGNQSRDYFPTIIAYKKDDDTCCIGEEAMKYRFSQKYDVYSSFKLSLGEDAHNKGGREKTPYEVTRDFLEMVIKHFCDQHGCKNLNNLVLTVPDIWKNEDKNKVAVDNLMQIFEELGLEAEEQVALESEPVSAAAYYCQQVCQKPYNGYVIVIDYGGGTLDLTLCHVKDGKNITVLRRCGNGGSDSKGCAGVAFDTALTKRLMEKNGLTGYDEGTKRFAKLCSAVEIAKINSTEQTRKALKAYYEAYDSYTGESFDDNVAFLVTVPSTDEDDEEFEVMASDVAEVFAQVNAPALNQALKTIKEHCTELNIDLHNQENMRVLMVGGFSNLYCVEAICRESLASVVSAGDNRFDDKMRQGGRPSIAIAHGASLIAAGVATIDYYCQSDVGFIYYDSGDHFETEKERMVPLTIIRKDTPVRSYKSPVYDDEWYSILYGTQELQLRLFFNDGGGVVPVTMEESFRELLGDMLEKDNAYQLGFSMGRHRIPMLHVRDKMGREKSVSLNRVLSRVALRRISSPKRQEETL